MRQTQQPKGQQQLTIARHPQKEATIPNQTEVQEIARRAKREEVAAEDEPKTRAEVEAAAAEIATHPTKAAEAEEKEGTKLVDRTG